MLTTGNNFLDSRFDYIVKTSNVINIQSPIVLLIDARTSCFPELLINALRSVRSDVYVIGATNSAGSAQYAMGTIMPYAILTYFKGIVNDAFGLIIDDNIGVVPNFIVQFDSYKDLFPYNDKIKRYALKYLGYSLEDNDKSQILNY